MCVLHVSYMYLKDDAFEPVYASYRDSLQSFHDQEECRNSISLWYNIGIKQLHLVCMPILITLYNIPQNRCNQPL